MVWWINGVNGKLYVIIEVKVYINLGIVLKIMLVDMLDKWEYSRYCEKLCNFKKFVIVIKRVKCKLFCFDGYLGDLGGKFVNKFVKFVKEVM